MGNEFKLFAYGGDIRRVIEEDARAVEGAGGRLSSGFDPKESIE